MKRCPSCSTALDAASLVCPKCGLSVESLLPTEALPPKATPPPGSKKSDAGVFRTSPELGRFLPGTLLGERYRIVGLLGRGGMGEVYRADDLKLGQVVALKFLPEALALDADRLERFHTEARIGRQISHPNVCRLYDLVELDGLQCLTMEYVDGEDLASLLRRIGRLPADKAVDIARDLCAGLAAAHDKGVIHRDLKPANVMIDGRGQARITDFGLAFLSGDTDGEWLVGTPAYMAPEQFEGQPASIRSDIYALGLVLYETFTGKRRFEAKSLAEIKALHAENKMPSLSSDARDIPPAVEQMILRCLEKAQEARPLTVRAIMAALPGGDPLQAALAAGETPSPAMVAAAGKVGDLRVGVAWAGLLAALAGLLLVAFLAGKTTVIARVRPDKPPEVLAEKAKEILVRLGYSDLPADTWHSFYFDDAYRQHVVEHDSSPSHWEKLDAIRPGPVLFVYRQSPRRLVALSRAVGLGPSTVGLIRPDDPPVDVPGMTEIVLDRRGWLTRLRAVPPQLDAAVAPKDPDWSALLAAAGLDASNLTPTPPRRAAPVDTDRKAAWDGVYTGQTKIPIHIEAAAYHGKPVWFEVQGPWVRPVSPEGPGPLQTAAAWIMLSFFVGAVVAMVVLGRRNLRLGRGDNLGAVRLASALFVTSTLALMFRADHANSLFDEYSLMVNILSQTLFWAVLVWMSYLALEPTARRRWPELLISWSRLLAGRVRDPLVGRDLLLGGLAGIAFRLLSDLGAVISPWFGLPPRALRGGYLSTLSASRHLVYLFLLVVSIAVFIGVGGLIGRFFYRALFRWHWFALGIQFLTTYVLFAVMIGADDLRSVSAALITALWLAVLLRIGVLASVVSLYFFFLLLLLPLTLDLSAWYAGPTRIAFGLFAALLLYGFHTSLGDKPLFGAPLLDPENVE